MQKTYQFTTPCESDEVTHPKPHKSFFVLDNVIARFHIALTIHLAASVVCRLIPAPTSSLVVKASVISNCLWAQAVQQGSSLAYSQSC